MERGKFCGPLFSAYDGTQELKDFKVYDSAQPTPSVDGLAKEVREGQASDNRRLTSLEEKTRPLETVLECSIFGVGGSSDAGSDAGVPDQPQPPQADDCAFAYYIESGASAGENLPAFILLESEGNGAMIGELSGYVPVRDTVLFFPTYGFSDDFSEISFFDGSGTLREKVGIEHIGQTDFTVTSGSLAGKTFTLSVSVASDVTDIFKAHAGGTR